MILPQKTRFLPYNPRLFFGWRELFNGGDSIAARRLQQAAVLSSGRGGFPPRGERQVPRAPRVLRPESARRPRGPAREHGARQALDRQGGAAFPDREAPREAVCKESRLRT